MRLLKLFAKVSTYYKKTIISNKKWLVFAAVILISGAFTGFLVTFLFPEMAEKSLSTYSKSIDKNIDPGWSLSWYVFNRNLWILTISNLLGIFLSIVPFLVTYINGFVLGVVLGYLPAKEIAHPLEILILILPHGIFEYAATLIMMSFGLRLGLNWIMAPKSLRLKTFFVDIKKLLTVYPLGFLLLLLAALIEGMLTLKIACFIGGICL